MIKGATQKCQEHLIKILRRTYLRSTKQQKKRNYQAKRPSWPNAEQGYDDILRSNNGARQRYDSARRNYDGARQGYEDANGNAIRTRYSYDGARSDHDHARLVYGNVSRNYVASWQGNDRIRQGRHRRNCKGSGHDGNRTKLRKCISAFS